MLYSPRLQIKYCPLYFMWVAQDRFIVSSKAVMVFEICWIRCWVSGSDGLLEKRRYFSGCGTVRRETGPCRWARWGRQMFGRSGSSKPAYRHREVPVCSLVVSECLKRNCLSIYFNAAAQNSMIYFTKLIFFICILWLKK